MNARFESLEEELLHLLEDEERYRIYHREMFPADGPFSLDKYPKHCEMFAAGALYGWRCMSGGNGVGKTLFGAEEVSYHATGRYPSWWQGLRFNRPIPILAAGDTRETTRDTVQAELIGNVAKEGDDAFGTGSIHRHLLGTPRYVQGTNKSCDFVPVRHISGGWSTISFKSYDQKRRAFQGTKYPFIWLDEEPPYDIFLECLMRGRGVDGRGLLTYTPLSGYTQLIEEFMDYERRNRNGDSKYYAAIGWDDVPHLTEEWKRRTLAATPAYLRNARSKGIPTSGEGRVYPVEEEQFVINPIPLPAHFRRVFGFDGGWHNTAVVWGAWDKDNDVIYIYSEYKRGEQLIPVHASAIKSRGDWIPGVGDAAAINPDDGKKLIALYRAEGINMKLPDKSVDAGIQKVLERLSSGRLKIFSTCQKTLDEIRRYRYAERKQGQDESKVVKTNDHLMDAMRYLVMSGLQRATTQKIAHVEDTRTRFG